MKTHGVPKSVYADGRNVPHHRRRAREFLHRHVPTPRRRHNPRTLAASQGQGGASERHTNAYAAGYEAEHNKRFSCPASGGDCHRPLPKWAKTIDDVCRIKSQRTIDNDWTVKYKNKGFQIQRWGSYPPAKSKVDVTETISGTVSITYRDKTTTFNKVATF